MVLTTLLLKMNPLTIHLYVSFVNVCRLVCAVWRSEGNLEEVGFFSYHLAPEDHS